MDHALTATQAWATVLGLAAPLFVLWWWARRHAPLAGDQRHFSVGYRSAPPAPAVHATEPQAATHSAVAMPEGMVDAPVMANPAVLAPLAAIAAAPASIAAEPMPTAALPPEPAGAKPPPALPPAMTEASLPTAAVAATPEVKPAAPEVKPAAPSVTASPKAEAIASPAKPAPEAKPSPAVSTPPAAPVAKAPTAAAPVVKPAARPTPPPKAAAPAAPPPAARTQPKPVPAPAAVPSAPSPATTNAAGEADDFSKVMGITAPIIAILQGAGIHTYRELAAADVAHLRELLEAAGLASVDPSTWPQQGRFAAGGKWKQLQTLQSHI